VSDPYILKVNGSDKEFAAGKEPGTLAELLEVLKVNAATVVAEVDGVIIDRAKFAETKLVGGQSVELVRFVGGG
jgi:thiamine biosynthesis protein ThiS